MFVSGVAFKGGESRLIGNLCGPGFRFAHVSGDHSRREREELQTDELPPVSGPMSEAVSPRCHEPGVRLADRFFVGYGGVPSLHSVPHRLSEESAESAVMTY